MSEGDEAGTQKGETGSSVISDTARQSFVFRLLRYLIRVTTVVVALRLLLFVWAEGSEFSFFLQTLLQALTKREFLLEVSLFAATILARYFLRKIARLLDRIISRVKSF